MRRTDRARRVRIALVAVLACLAATAPLPSAGARPAGAGKDHRPNVLVVMTDDMATSDVKYMPNVKRLLARKGTTFTDAITSFPLCCPARATFLTGQYAHNHGVAGNFHPNGWYGMADRENVLPAWVDDAGYRTAFVGKWLNGYGALDAHGEIPAGFDTWRGLLDLSAYDYLNFVMNADGELRTWGDPEFAQGLVEFGNIQVTPGVQTLPVVFDKLAESFGPPPYDYWGTEDPAAKYSPDVTGKMTRRLVRAERDSRKPFFVWWAPASPHREDVATTLMHRPGPDPRPPARYADEVAQLELPRPPSFNEADVSDKPSNIAAQAETLNEEEIAQLELDFQGRIGSLMAVDDRVGDLVATLRKTDQLRNTMIVFLSDNGWLHGQHRIPGDKFLPYEESLKVPLIIRGPGVVKGRKVRDQVANIDFAPTLLDAAKAKAGRRMDGTSLLPVLRHEDRRPAERAVAIEALQPLFVDPIPVNTWDRSYQGIRTERYTYIVWTETGERELYDRKTDPHQLENIAGPAPYSEVELRLERKLEQLAACGGRACNVKP